MFLELKTIKMYDLGVVIWFLAQQSMKDSNQFDMSTTEMMNDYNIPQWESA